MEYIKNIKEKVIEALFERDVWTKQVDDKEIRTRCPFCGDSVHSDNTGHLYIRIDLNDDFYMVYHCFRCEEKGIVNKELLSLLGIYDIDLQDNVQKLNKRVHSTNSYGTKYYNMSERQNTLFFDYHIPEFDINDSNDKKKFDYVFSRIGISDYTREDVERLKIITSFKMFLIENDIKELNTTASIANMLEDHYVGFLSYGNSYILFRDITEKEKIRWLKYPITKNSKGSRIFYAISSDIDILTDDTITINMGEGIMDIMSCYYNLGYNKDNTINIATCGKGYMSILRYLLELGFVGSNVVLNIFADNDKEFNKKMKKDDKSITDIRFFENVLRNIKYLFGEVNIYYNAISKDIGVPKEEIILRKHKI